MGDSPAENRALLDSTASRRESATVPDEYELEHLIELAVKRQMISDVPIRSISFRRDRFLFVGSHDGSDIAADRSEHFLWLLTKVTWTNLQSLNWWPERFETNHTVLRAEESE